MHESILRYKKNRYQAIAAVVLLVSGILFATQGHDQVPNGGTWQGYVLGSIATALILWLAALGIRKRAYSSNLGTVQGWTSAHVYLGIAVLFVATLHNAAQVGWNVHTLAYVLMCIVIISGGVGIYTYLKYPRLLSKNRAGRTDSAMFAELNALNEQGIKISRHCDSQVRQVIDTSIARTAIGGGLLAQLLAIDNSKLILPLDDGSHTKLVANTDQQKAIDFVAYRIPRTRKKNEASELQRLLVILCRRQTLLRQIRKDIQLRAGMNVWLFVHIPMTIALLVCLAIHIFSVFFFW